MSILIDEWKSLDSKKVVNILIKPPFDRPFFRRSVNVAEENLSHKRIGEILHDTLKDFDSNRFICLTTDNALAMKSVVTAMFDSYLLNVYNFGCVCHVLDIIVEKIITKIDYIKVVQDQILNLNSKISQAGKNITTLNKICREKGIHEIYFPKKFNTRLHIYIR